MQRFEILELISRTQADGTAPVQVSIGSVSNGQVQHRTLVITDAPPAILTLIRGLIGNGLAAHAVSIGGGGVTIQTG